MASIRCICGHSLSNTCCPNLLEGEIKGIYEYDSRSVWECIDCGRLAIDVKDSRGLTVVKWYKPEDEKPGELFNIGNSDQFLKYLKDLWRDHGTDFIKLEIAKIRIE
jgi:hypothetical protein